MFLTIDESDEIAQIEWAANFLKARANAAITYAYSAGMYEFDTERVLKGAADALVAADKLQGRANMLQSFGRDYRAQDFHVPEDEEAE